MIDRGDYGIDGQDNFWTRPVHEAMKKAVMGRDPNEISIERTEDGEEDDEESGRVNVVR